VIAEQQQVVVAEARRWLNTPFHHEAAVLGAGVDCVMLLCCVFHDAGVLPWIDPRPYPHDWMLHRSDERYLLGLDEYAHKLPAGTPPEPGDIQTFRFARTHSHAGIISVWPRMVHAYLPAGRVILDRVDALAFAGRLGPLYRIETDSTGVLT
jgi:cell wall-associated NlpC family hydrolase